MSDATTIDELLGQVRRIAVVGASANPARPSHGVVSRLVAAGYEVVPVNPNVEEVLGLPSVASLAEVAGPVDLVDVFRRIEHVVEVAEEAAAVGAGGLWLQLGLRSAAARRVAADAGLSYVEDRCLAAEVDRRGARPPAA